MSNDRPGRVPVFAECECKEWHQQCASKYGSNGLGSTMTMSGIKADYSGEAYNNPFEMVPTAGKLFQQMSSTFLSVTSTEGRTNTKLLIEYGIIYIMNETHGRWRRGKDVNFLCVKLK
jgi:hypothetical protein